MTPQKIPINQLCVQPANAELNKIIVSVIVGVTRLVTIATLRIRRALATTLMSLFQDVRYFLPSSFPEDRAAELRLGLDKNGAVAVDSTNGATHIITNTNRFESWQEVGDAVAVVTVRVSHT